MIIKASAHSFNISGYPIGWVVANLKKTKGGKNYGNQ